MFLFQKLMPTMIDNTLRTNIRLTSFTEKSQRLLMLLTKQ